MAAIDINRATTGVNLPPEVASEIWGGLTENSAVMAASRRINLPGAGVTIPLITGDAAASWVNETEEKPVSRSTLSNKVMSAYTLAVIEPFSNQFRRDLPALYAELVRRLPFALARKFDETVFGVADAPGSNFDRLTEAPALVVDGADTLKDLAAVYQAVAAAGGDVSAWLASPSLQGLLFTATDAQGRQFFVANPASEATVGSVFGRPVYSSRAAMPAGVTGFGGDFAGSAVYGTVEGVQISISDQATLNDGGTAINLWQRNMFAVRAEVEVGFRIRDPKHFAQIKAAS